MFKLEKISKNSNKWVDIMFENGKSLDSSTDITDTALLKVGQGFTMFTTDGQYLKTTAVKTIRYEKDFTEFDTQNSTYRITPIEKALPVTVAST